METTKSLKHNALKLDDMRFESADVEINTIMDRLNRIAELKVEDFVPVSEGKITTTIKDMYGVVKNLEGNLRHYLNLNEALKSETQDLKKQNQAFADDCHALKSQLKELENNSILAKDVEKTLELTIEEKDKYRQLYLAETQKVAQLRREMDDLLEAQRRTKEERDDCYKEVILLENKLASRQWEKEKAALEHKCAQGQSEIEKLRAELEKTKSSN